MRKIFVSSVFVLIFSAAMFAQTDKSADCPTLSITGPSGIVAPNDSAVYIANIDTKGKELNIEYIWSINAGEILEGQGTNTIKIKQPEFHTLTATVAVKGFPKDCPNIASETSIGDPTPAAEKIDELSLPLSKTGNFKNDKLIKAIQADPSAQLYIIIGFKEKNLSETQIEKERNFLNALAIENEIPYDRITVVRIVNSKELAEFWIVPAGAIPPGSKKRK